MTNEIDSNEAKGGVIASRRSMLYMSSVALVFSYALAAQPAFSMTASEVFEIASKSTVVVKKLDANGKIIGLGSGVVLPGGDIVTNCHVVEGAVKITVKISGKDYPAILHYSDWDRDVCSVSSNGIKQNTPVSMGSTKKLKVGKPVYAIGSPQGLELTLSDGIVSSLREVEDGNYIQTTAAISPGSGLFDENGALVGLTTFYLTEGQNLNFAVPVEWVTELPKRHKSNQVKSQSVKQWMNKAIELESRKDWAALLDHCLPWTKSQPRLADAWNALGIAYAETGQTTKAIESFLQAVRINSEYAVAWYNLGNAYGKSGQYAKSIESSQQAIRIDQDYEKAWNNLGAAYGKSGESAKAMECYQQAIRINPEYADAWYNLGTAYGKSGQAAKTIESYQQAIRINPEYADAWFNVGNIYGKTGQTAKAIESYKQVIRINPQYAVAWYNLGFQYVKSGETAMAIECYQQAIRINPEYADAWFNLGICYRISGQSSKVTEVYKRLKNINSAQADKFFNEFVMP